MPRLETGLVASLSRVLFTVLPVSKWRRDGEGTEKGPCVQEADSDQLGKVPHGPKHGGHGAKRHDNRSNVERGLLEPVQQIVTRNL